MSLNMAVKGMVVDVSQPSLMGDEITLSIAESSDGQVATVFVRKMTSGMWKHLKTANCVGQLHSCWSRGVFFATG